MPVPEAVQAKERTQSAHGEVLVGLKYIPDDKLGWCPMGKAKTARHIGLECAGAYKWGAAVIRGGPAEWAEAKEDEYPTRESVVELLNASFADFAAALDAVTEEQLNETREVFWGTESVRSLLWMNYWHSVYHAGQLNYIQTMLGDTKMHME
jgi:uncharacterized damage-inducible protein DinB